MQSLEYMSMSFEIELKGAISRLYRRLVCNKPHTGRRYATAEFTMHTRAKADVDL